MTSRCDVITYVSSQVRGRVNVQSIKFFSAVGSQLLLLLPLHLRQNPGYGLLNSCIGMTDVHRVVYKNLGTYFYHLSVVIPSSLCRVAGISYAVCYWPRVEDLSVVGFRQVGLIEHRNSCKDIMLKSSIIYKYQKRRQLFLIYFL